MARIREWLRSMSVAPQVDGSTSSTDCENVQTFPARSVAEYCRSPNGNVAGSAATAAPAA